MSRRSLVNPSLTLALAALLSGAAPSPANAATVAGTAQARSVPPVAFYVQNQTEQSFSVSLERGGIRTVLGRVSQGERLRFEVPPGILTDGEVRLVASAAGNSRKLISEPFYVRAGEDVAWRVWEAPGVRGSIGWAMLRNKAPVDAHRYTSRRG